MVLVGHNEAGQRVAVHAWAKGGVVRMVPLGDETRVAAAWRVLGVTDG
jgi:hypothetical protein